MIKNNLNIKKFLRMLAIGTLSLLVGILGSEIDSIVSGNLLGEQALAAVGITISINTFFIFASVLIGNGGAILYNKYIGNFENKTAYKCFGTCLIASFMLGIILFFTMSTFQIQVLKLFELSDEINNIAINYMVWYKIVALIYPAYWLLYEMIYNDGGELISGISDIIQFSVNITLSFILCSSIGISGVGLSTMISVILSSCSLLLHFFQKSNSIKIKLCFEIKLLLSAVKLSMAKAFIYLFSTIINIVLNLYVVYTFGEYYLPVLNMLFLIYTLGGIIAGLGAAITPFICTYYSEKNNTGIKTIMYTALATAIFLGFVFIFVYSIFADYFPNILGIESPELIDYSIFLVRATATCIIFTPILFLIAQYYLLTDKIIDSLVIIFIFLGLSPICSPIICSMIGGFNGLIIGYAIHPLCSFILIFIYSTCRFGIKKLPFPLKDYDNKIKNINVEAKQENSQILEQQVKNFLIDCIPNNNNESIINECKEKFSEIICLNKNNKKKVLCEFNIVIFKNKVNLIVKDNGIVIDPNDAKFKEESKTSISKKDLQNNTDNSEYTKNTGFNRSCFTYKIISE